MEETGKPKLGGVAPSLMSRGSCGCGGWAGQDPAPFGAVGGRLPGGLKAVGSPGAPGCPFLDLPLSFPVPPSLPSKETISTATSNLRALPRSCSAVPRTLVSGSAGPWWPVATGSGGR